MTSIFITGPKTADHEGAISQVRSEGLDVVGLVDEDDDRHPIEQRTEAIFDADGVATLSGWRSDPASTIEVMTARSQAKPIGSVCEILTRLAPAPALA